MLPAESPQGKSFPSPSSRSLDRSSVLAVALLSGASLSYEILLIRLFSIVDWYPFTFLVISLALLGYGASGTFLAMLRNWLLPRFATAAAAGSAGFALTAIGAFLISQRIEFNSLEIMWSRRQLGLLFVLYLLFAIPFFCAATSVGLTLARFAEESPRIYRADLIGAGSSAAAITLVLFILHPLDCLLLVGCIGFISAALFLLPRRMWAAILLGAGLAAILAVRPLLFPLHVSQFKELSMALRLPGARIVEERSNPLALLTVVENSKVPFRFAPGLSLNYTDEIPRQIGVFSDGGSLTVVSARGSHLDFVPSAVVYHLRGKLQNAAVIGAGGGTEVLSALDHGVETIAAVEINPQMVEMVRQRSPVYSDPRVTVVTAEGRHFIGSTAQSFDLIQIALLDSLAASAAGVQALSTSYLYTVEAFQELMTHLRPGGYLVITRWMQVPPRDMIKLFATAVAVLERLQISPSRSLALIRSWNTASLIVKRGEFASGEIDALHRFADERSFDVDYVPDIGREDVNRYNVLEEPYLFDAASVLLSERREDFFERYKFFVRPATDNRPFFFHTFKWRALPELLRLRERGGMALIEWGYFVVVAGVAQALVASLVLIVVPLVWIRRASGVEPAWRLIAYFASIGFGFLFLEIAFIQSLTLILGHPLYAVAVALASFLLFAGIGSGYSKRFQLQPAIPIAVAVMALVEIVVVRGLSGSILGLNTPMRLLISIVLVAPLAFLMGMPFPLALRRLSQVDPAAVPWAWAINGSASVVSAMSATILAVHAGFSGVALAAAVLYGIAALTVASRHGAAP
ncbi:MAG TPA: methyltransferase domain-containing protein [Thermoanaerobaculia bacterium]